MNTNIDHIIKVCRSIQSEWKYLKENAVKLRNEFLTTLVEFYHPLSLNKQKIIQNIMKMEDRKRQFRRIKNATTSIDTSPFDHLLIGSEDQPTRIDNPIEIATNVLEKYKSIIATQIPSLPINPHLISDFGLYGEKNNVIDLLNGTYYIETNKYSVIETQLLNACQFVSPFTPNPKDIIITPAEFCTTFKKVREDTSTTPTSPHIGHYTNVGYPELGGPHPLHDFGRYEYLRGGSKTQLYIPRQGIIFTILVLVVHKPYVQRRSVTLRNNTVLSS